MEFKEYVLRQMAIIRANAENEGTEDDENEEDEQEEREVEIKPHKLSMPVNERNSDSARLLAELDNLSGLNLSERALFA